MAENDKRDSRSPAHFLTEGIIFNILLRLPIASCIFRFRCVCRSWRILLSDPQFIRKFLFFRSFSDQRSLQILISGGHLDAVSNKKKFYCSLHSYATLRPISAAGGAPELPSNPDKIRDPWTRLTVVGCCDGIFCISDANDFSAAEIVLWNPTTSEAKFLQRSTIPRSGSKKDCEAIGVGFDPLTGDYKVVRTLRYVANYDSEDDDDYYGYGYGYGHPPQTTYKCWVLAEV